MGKDNFEYVRLKNLLLQDKVSAPQQFADAIKSDVYKLLGGYMDLYAEDLKITIASDENGFQVNITARTDRFKQIGLLPKPYDGNGR